MNICFGKKRHQVNMIFFWWYSGSWPRGWNIPRNVLNQERIWKSVKTYCEEEFIDAFNTSPIGIALTGTCIPKKCGTVSDLKNIKDLVDRKEKLKEVRLICLKVEIWMNFLNDCHLFFYFAMYMGIQMRIVIK